jgi:HAD superfamily 5'-nucleotidase-like hydrolase
MKQKNNDVRDSEKIFCNRTLNMNSIKAIGFDMDYTLALYKSETFENLAYVSTLKKLVNLGYPKEILKWKFDPHAMIRGLVIDKIHGNILKIDRHRYVKVAYHGFQRLSSEERRRIYDVEEVLSYEEPNYALIDTLFTIGEAFLFTQLVDLKDSSKKLINHSYAQIFKDIRVCLDTSHRDGSIKDAVAENPGKYIIKNPHFKETMAFLRASGKKLFIVTNSLWDYAQVVMNYLYTGEKGPLTYDWLKDFDLVITGAQKPDFFKQTNPIFEVDVKNKYLRNTEEIDLQKSKVYQGGYYKQLHESFDIKTGSEVLYVGDHIYGDIVRSKKIIGWRTMIVIQELTHEIETLHKNRKQFLKCEQLAAKREVIENKYKYLKFLKEQNKLPLKQEKTLQALFKEYEAFKSYQESQLTKYNNEFHPIWGAVMKTANQNSRFAAQVEGYACLYTSEFTNLRHYMPYKLFKAPTECMPHDPEGLSIE